MYVVVTTKFAESLALENREQLGGNYLIGFFLPTNGHFYIHGHALRIETAEADCSHLNGGPRL